MTARKLTPCSTSWHDVVDHQCEGHRPNTRWHRCPCGAYLAQTETETETDR